VYMLGSPGLPELESQNVRRPLNWNRRGFSVPAPFAMLLIPCRHVGPNV
jgi:hypothetical protein